MSCMCWECKHQKIIEDNHGQYFGICACRESEKFSRKVDWDDCDQGEVDTYDEEEADDD